MSNIEEGPIWQEDDDVSCCFLCSSAYHLFNRRHHCRKCGRVVCGACSQQTVKYFPNTIIVNSEDIRSVAESSDSYRTCDLCVDEIRMIRRALFNHDNGRTGGSSNASTVSSPRGESEPLQQEGELDDGGSLIKHTSRTTTKLIHITRNKHRRRSSSRPDSESDENLCPVCAQDLLKLYIQENKTHIEDITNDNFENFKSDHINDCLIAFDFNGDHTRMSPDKIHTRNKMLVYNIPPIPKPMFESIPQESLLLPEEEEDIRRNSVLSEDGGSSEKRIEDEFESECVICLEELKPGDKVGRLECLCVFHYKCIKDWFNKKGFGECPVHFLHK
ncbi:E3 ubiquitin-protein ligase PIB1 [Spathaspora sp. JA1]|nr:E3 ubiquitin-protein ligase PIB1 [Spathaspora sp. JA1]